MQRAVGPLSQFVVGIVPAVSGPVSNTNGDILIAISVEIDVLPLIRTDFSFVIDIGRYRDSDRLLQTMFMEVPVFPPGRQKARLAVHIRDLHILQSFADTNPRPSI